MMNIVVLFQRQAETVEEVAETIWKTNARKQEQGLDLCFDI